MGIFGNITEALKKTFTTDINHDDNLSNNTSSFHQHKILSDDPVGGSLVTSNINDRSYGYDHNYDRFQLQNNLISKYRVAAGDTEISTAIDIICNEIAYTNDPSVFKIEVDEENDKLRDTIADSFNDVLDLLNIHENIHTLSRQFYIDGQLNVALAYNQNDVKKGITKATIVTPINLYFDADDKLWKYNTELEEYQGLYGGLQDEKESYTESEMVHKDFGLYVRPHKLYQLNASYLENAIKNSNILNTLENLLVPYRYSRSVSRRLFNIDIADLPPKQAQQMLDKIRAEFTYKKTYDPVNGLIKNQHSTQNIVEDYWMSNRSGGRGTTVDTIDERGSALDMEDIIYASKKLYNSLKIPQSRSPYSEDSSMFGMDETSVTQEELGFYIFISRLRIPIVNLITEILRRQLVATGVLSDKDWMNYSKKISIQFTAESLFLENLKNEQFLKNIENFTDIQPQIGKVISVQTAIKKTFNWTNVQFEEELEAIEQEKENPLYGVFYGDEEDDY